MMIWHEAPAGQVRLTASDQDTLLDDIGQRFGTGQGFALATLNLDHMVKLQRDAQFANA